MTNEEAIDYNKNLKEYMKITDKKSEYKFLQENYEALDMSNKALEIWNNLFKSYEVLIKEITKSGDIKNATKRIDDWCIEQLRGIISDYYADLIIKENET